MSLSVDLTHRRGDFELHATFDAGPGVTALFGPSGSGKTTLLDLIAGLERPGAGRVMLDGEPLVDTAGGHWVPIHRRQVGYVFQDSRLFPHLSVRQNLDYGARLAGGRRTGAGSERIVELLALGALLERRPATLSGGEKQRVAIGRALLAAPRILLLDEPMASVDVARRAEILPYLARVREDAGIPIIYVSHTLAEVARLADVVVLLDAGRIRAVGPVADLLGRLDLGETSQGAEAGAVLTATVRTASDGSAVTVLRHPAGEFRVPWAGQSPGSTVRLHVLARDVALATGPVGTVSIRNRLAARIVEIGRSHGGVCEIRLDAGGEMLLARVTEETVTEMELAPGLAVTALIKSVALER